MPRPRKTLRIGIPSSRPIRFNGGEETRHAEHPFPARNSPHGDQEPIHSRPQLRQRRGPTAREIPLFPVERTMQLGLLAAARAAAGAHANGRVGWAAIFLKAYGIVARETPSLRTWLVRGFLFSRLATASESVATLAVNRIEDGEDRLIWGRLAAPDTRSLPEIQQFIVDCATKPMEEMFKRQLQLEMVPSFLRRTILRWNMNSFSRKRATRIGTFSLSTLAGMGATNRFHPTICTTSLSYAPLRSRRPLPRHTHRRPPRARRRRRRPGTRPARRGALPRDTG